MLDPFQKNYGIEFLVTAGLDKKVKFWEIKYFSK